MNSIHRNPLRFRPFRSMLLLGALWPALGGAGTASGNRPELNLPRTAEYDYDVPEPGTYRLPILMEAGDGTVLGTEGQPTRLRQTMQGRITVLSFIYTRCPDPRACPKATGALRQLQVLTRRDPVLAGEMLLATMSFDPAFDSPRVMKAFAQANRLGESGAPWRFLTAPSARELNPILEAYGQTIDRRPDDPTRRIFHPVRVYLIDRQGQVRNIYSFGLLDPRMVMTDIRTLLMEEAGQAQAVPATLPAAGPSASPRNEHRIEAGSLGTGRQRQDAWVPSIPATPAGGKLPG